MKGDIQEITNDYDEEVLMKTLSPILLRPGKGKPMFLSFNLDLIRRAYLMSYIGDEFRAKQSSFKYSDLGSISLLPLRSMVKLTGYLCVGFHASDANTYKALVQKCYHIAKASSNKFSFVANPKRSSRDANPFGNSYTAL